MKSARIITKTRKSSKVAPGAASTSLAVVKTKTSTRKSFKPSAKKITAETQFERIKEAIDEVELIEAGKIQAPSLKDALDEL